MNELVTPMIQIRATTAIVYNKYTGSRKKSVLKQFQQQQKKKIENFQKRAAYSGELTAGAIKRMSKSLNLLVEATPTKTVFNPVIKKNVQHKLSFITLTIPNSEIVELKTASKLLLEPLLKHLRQVHGMRGYVWKAEAQKRGQLHYHIVSDCFIFYQELRNKWNALLSKHGFNSDYVQKTGHTDANSTDIHSLRNVKDLASYFIKYFTKQYQNDVQMKGKLWDCSKNLKQAKYFETELTADIEYDLFRLQQAQKAVIKHRDSFTFIKFKGFTAVTVFPAETKNAYFNHLINIRNGTVDLFSIPENRTIKTDSRIELPTISQTMPKPVQLQLFLN